MTTPNTPPSAPVTLNVPRAFDSAEQPRSGTPLCLIENVECAHCSVVFEGVFRGDADTVEDLTDPPVGSHVCPRCGHQFTSEMSGWMFYSEAG